MTADTPPPTSTAKSSTRPRRSRNSASKETPTKQQPTSPRRPVSSNKRVVISRHDMDDAMQKEAVALAHDAIAKFKMEQDMACYIKKAMDTKHGANWHCVVGNSFGSYITHDPKCFILFYIDKTAFQLYKIG